MDVHFYIFFLIIQTQVSWEIKGQNTGKYTRRRSDDNIQVKHTEKDLKSPNKNNIDFYKNEEGKDYFLTPIFPRNDDTDEEDDPDDNSYLDYEYDTKENYKDSPSEHSTVKPANSQDGFDDKLPLHTMKDNLPMFLLEPENTYVVKNKPANLKCKAASALEVYFKCNGVKAQATNFEFVDPHNGVRIVEGEYKVTREQVEEYFGTDKFQCSCFAWNSRGQIRSQPAYVELAYIKKQFTVSPQSALVKQYAQASFRCDPPPAAPFAQLYWLKNGAPVTETDNLQVSKEGELLIKQASLLDMANYSCVAENVAGKRISEPALLTVFVNGGWSAWSSWGECSCADNPGSGRRRVRSCTAPRPLNGGQPCLGTAVQRTPDCLECDLDYVEAVDDLTGKSPDILLRTWSQWSDWTRCDSDCLQSRRRRCLAGAGCLGKDYQVAQCPLCVRTSKTDMTNDASTYWPLFIALSLALFIFIIIMLLGIKYLKLRMSENSPYVKPPPGSNYFGNVIRRTLTNQPDLTIHEEFQTIDSKQRYTSTSTNTQFRNEHLYEVPQLANSYISPIDHELRSNAAVNRINNYSSNNNAEESECSNSSCFMSSGSSYGSASVEMSPSLKNNLSVDSKYERQTTMETATSKIISSEGGCLCLEKCDVKLLVPEGAIEEDERELFSIEVDNEEWHRPILQEGETQLSPIIRCGLKNLHFRKALVLSFPHCGLVNDSTWSFSILQKTQEISSRQWSKVLTLGQETQGTPLFAQIDTGKVFLMCEYLSDFVLIGKSFSGIDAKILKVCVFIVKKSDVKDKSSIIMRVHVLEDTLYAFSDCIENETKIGGTLVNEVKTMYFHQNCSDLCFNIRDVGGGWKVKTIGNYQEIPFSKIWNLNKPLYCTYIFQQTDPIDCLQFNLSVYQKQKQSNCVTFDITTSDSNSNLYNGLIKRYSYSSVDKFYTGNLIENPFNNYCSLTKRDSRYDFVYKHCNTLLKSNVSLADNVRVLRNIDKAFLCKLLDVQIPKGNDWRMLAEKLKIDGYYYFFSNACSPTEYILNLWECRNNEPNMLINLARIFSEMSRVDCATIVERNCVLELPNYI